MNDRTDELGLYVFVALLTLVPMWRLCRRAGHSPALALLMFVPPIGIPLVLWIVAFSKRTAAA